MLKYIKFDGTNLDKIIEACPYIKKTAYTDGSYTHLSNNQNIEINQYFVYKKDTGHFIIVDENFFKYAFKEILDNL